jgi:hypothetical protein
LLHWKAHSIFNKSNDFLLFRSQTDPTEDCPEMKIAVLNAESFPVPPALGGPIAQTIYETALAYSKDRMVVVSPWSDSLDGWTYCKTQFRHVVPDGAATADWDGETGLDALAASYLKSACDIIQNADPVTCPLLCVHIQS